jgi:hypothetical protein
MEYVIVFQLNDDNYRATGIGHVEILYGGSFSLGLVEGVTNPYYKRKQLVTKC